MHDGTSPYSASYKQGNGKGMKREWVGNGKGMAREWQGNGKEVREWWGNEKGVARRK
jgi:hypothetical protein